ncbi:hypothetical protein NUW54_g7358 [Trametes sanguinea]|uniref:Uncharacterized protein n=1 Tax=Trametes sanguinea TaxID=158606 RepID=A0ACC1PMR2_9APHY|nr:hypothetical protein NUW54_g7358 [Trametes sanguinea]
MDATTDRTAKNFIVKHVVMVGRADECPWAFIPPCSTAPNDYNRAAYPEGCSSPQFCTAILRSVHQQAPWRPHNRHGQNSSPGLAPPNYEAAEVWVIPPGSIVPTWMKVLAGRRAAPINPGTDVPLQPRRSPAPSEVDMDERSHTKGSMTEIDMRAPSR